MRDHRAVSRLGQSNYDLSDGFWADGAYTLVWVLLEPPIGEVPLAPERTSAVARVPFSLSGY